MNHSIWPSPIIVTDMGDSKRNTFDTWDPAEVAVQVDPFEDGTITLRIFVDDGPAVSVNLKPLECEILRQALLS